MGVNVGEGVFVAIAVGVGDAVLVTVGSGVGECARVAVGSRVGDGATVAVGSTVCVDVGSEVGVGAIGTGAGVTASLVQPHTNTAMTKQNHASLRCKPIKLPGTGLDNAEWNQTTNRPFDNGFPNGISEPVPNGFLTNIHFRWNTTQ